MPSRIPRTNGAAAVVSANYESKCVKQERRRIVGGQGVVKKSELDS